MSRRFRLAIIFGSAAAMLAGAMVSVPAWAAPAAAGRVTAAVPAGLKPPVPSSQRPAGPVPAGFASWAAVYAMQHRLNAAAVQISAASGGNANIVAAPQSRKLVVYWHGPVPAAVRAQAGRLGVPVTFRPAAFSLRRLAAAAKRLAAGRGVASAAPKPDGSGLAVTVTSPRLASPRSAALAGSGIPLTVTVGSRARLAFSRQADTPAFYGGSRYNTSAGGCTNGFALNVSGQPHVWEISAGHCGGTAVNVDGQAANIPGWPTPGTLFLKSVCRDTLLIDYPSTVAGQIYTGAFNSSSSAAVIGDQPDFDGNLVNTGGASSGEHDNLTVQNVDEFDSFPASPSSPGITGCSPVGPLTRAGYSNNTCAVAPGDSGGPVFSYLFGYVEAQGTITAETGSASCPGVSPNGGNGVLYAPLLRPDGDMFVGSLQFYGQGILTSSG